MFPSQLPDAIQLKIDQGDDLLDAGDFAAAEDCYSDAITLLPDPKHAHDISLCAFTALGEARLHAGKYVESLAAFKTALKASGGVENPLLHLRLGQAYFETGNLNQAADSLARAYALDGLAVFAGEDDKYLSFLSTQIEL